MALSFLYTLKWVQLVEGVLMGAESVGFLILVEDIMVNDFSWFYKLLKLIMLADKYPRHHIQL